MNFFKKIKKALGFKVTYDSLLEEIVSLDNDKFSGLTNEQRDKLKEIQKELPLDVFVNLCRNSSYNLILEFYDFYKKGMKIARIENEKNI